ncbi:kinase-like protein [Mycena sp. CBHHK59/15]|nr:kinase-like protein [Mycena sp. CBHHK59/15]
MSCHVHFCTTSLVRPLHRSFLKAKLRYMSTIHEPRFIPSRLAEVECVEEYRRGGLHPILIGDEFAHGRYKIMHKLGFGGSSTIWLARDQQKQSGGLVTLKAMRADASSKSPNHLPEICVPKSLQAAFPSCGVFQTVEDNFRVLGPNGDHQFLISPLAGPSILAMSDCPGRVSGSRRLRGDLARRVAKQTAEAIYCMHTAGLVHGDLTTSNILFRVSQNVLRWSDDDVYGYLGVPETEEVRTRGGLPREPHAPASLVGCIENSKLTTDASFLEERVLVIDFGQSYAIESPPNDYQPGTVMNYQSPEARFEGRAGLETDVWALGCAIFEIRAGFPLFDSFFGSDTDILRQTVETLGRLPDPWWGSFTERARWFEEDGEPKSAQAQERAGIHIQASKSSIRDKLRSIGTEDDLPDGAEGPMVEKSGVRLLEEEVELLGDLLDKMLRYRPEERIVMEDVVGHPWFKYEGMSV